MAEAGNERVGSRSASSWVMVGLCLEGSKERRKAIFRDGASR